MDFSLSSSLVGSAVLNPDRLSLDLQFAADKTLTARKGPTPTFTRGSTATFVGSNGLIQSAAVNAPRFDHDPITGVCKGLLIEESRTNTMLSSEQFNSALWNAAGLRTLTVTANDTVSPSGFLDADRLTVGATTTSYRVVQNTANVISGTAYTFSCFLKADQVTRAQISSGNTTTLPLTAVFDLTGNGSVVSNTFGTASIQNYGNGWYRCIITGTAGANSNTSMSLYPVTGTSIIYPGNSVDSFYAWGAQLEAGAFATSYIPNASVISSAVRSADVCSITGSAFTGFYNQSEGTLFSNATPQTVDQVSVVVGVNTTASTASHFIYKVNSSISAAGKRWGAQTVSLAGAQTTITTSTDVAVSRASLAYSFKLNDFAFAYAGSIVGTDNSGTMPTPTTMRIGSRDDGLYINGHIASVRYYRKRLPNAKLQTITV